MSLLDILFKIYFSPLKSFGVKGRLVATYWLCMPLAFVSLGIFNTATFMLRLSSGIDFMISPGILGVLGLLITIGWQMFLERKYVRDCRDLGVLLHAGLATLLLLAFLFLSIAIISLSYLFLWKV